MAYRFVFPEKQKLIFEEFSPEALRPGTVRVRTQWSLMSTGTENIAFNGIFNPASHWGRYVRYPFRPGYATVGKIVEIAADVTSLAVGDQVFHMMQHASEHVVAASSVFPIPDRVDLRDATWCALAGIAFVAIRRAQIAAGETTAVIGAGPVGQMTVRWARAAGSGRVIVIDPAADRHALAKKGGATDTIALQVSDSLDSLLAINGGRRPPVVIDATGRAATLAEALPLVADFGRLIVVGDTGTPTEQHLTSDVLSRGLTIVGVHGNHMPYLLGIAGMFPTEVTPPDSMMLTRTAGWRAFAQIFFEAVKNGSFNLDGTITHRFQATDAADAYALVNGRRQETMGVLFDWGESRELGVGTRARK